ncbi:MAG: 2-amino-4-hydroxy-6-hydroxymethyldihydropteridine diphosphokinase [Coriobacteriia bacterium]|nr:2-amino-4-hydroxy-6-hydroxymethyldihydropteridine diphosphokinase [Coriobacteriia bacterium]
MRVHIGLGSNLEGTAGDRLEMLASALRDIGDLGSTSLVAVAEVFESVAWPDPSDPPFANTVAVIDTRVPLDTLREACAAIEDELGRDRRSKRNAPRPIDIDILLAGTEEWNDESLTVPHPRMAERDFVITPLLGVDPDVRWPDGSPVTRAGIRVGRVTRTLGPLPGFERLTRVSAPIEPSPATVTRSTTSAPGHEQIWEPVLEFGSDPSLFALAHAAPLGGMSGQVGMAGQVDGSFAEMVLGQEGIEFAWDPFRPGDGSDPYGFSRRFRLLVPAPLAERARKLLEAAAAAPVDWSASGEDFPQ